MITVVDLSSDNPDYILILILFKNLSRQIERFRAVTQPSDQIKRFDAVTAGNPIPYFLPSTIDNIGISVYI
jgi:hypothetical protein